MKSIDYLKNYEKELIERERWLDLISKNPFYLLKNKKNNQKGEIK